MAIFKIKKAVLISLLLLMCSFSHANSNQNIYQMTLSILSYAKISSPQPDLCLIDNTVALAEFNQIILKQNSKIKAQNIHDYELNKTNCDVIFFSKSSPTVEQKLIGESLNKSILSFSTNNEDCEVGSVFCLYSNKAGITKFKVNLDSLAKTKIHVDPRVLLLAQNME